jgi:hypothetical protein
MNSLIIIEFRNNISSFKWWHIFIPMSPYQQLAHIIFHVPSLSDYLINEFWNSRSCNTHRPWEQSFIKNISTRNYLYLIRRDCPQHISHIALAGYYTWKAFPLPLISQCRSTFALRFNLYGHTYYRFIYEHLKPRSKPTFVYIFIYFTLWHNSLWRAWTAL